MKEKALRILTERLREEPFASVLCYPKPTEGELSKRLVELRRLGVNSIEFEGEKHAFNLPVLGKGYVGIVTIAYRNEEKAALKIRRVDATRSRMQREAEMLKKANSVGVGPRLLDVSANFLLMQFIDGVLLPKWLEKCRKQSLVKKVLREILEQCWRLDEAHLDHGELSHAPKHIIIESRDTPIIVDFETASINRKLANVTSICHFLFMGGSVAKKLTEKLGERNEKSVVEVLRHYKNDRTRENFEKVLKVCGV